MTEQNGNPTNVYTPMALCFAAVLLVCALFAPVPGIVSVIIAALCITVAILFTRNQSTLAVGSVATLVLTGVSIGGAAYVAAQAGTTLSASFAATGAEVQQIFLQAYGNAATPEVHEALAHAVDLAMRLWPLTYLVSAVITVAASFGVCSFITRRFGIDLKITPLAQLDFSPTILWVPVAGLLVFAASFVFKSDKELLVTIALNLAAVTKIALIVQATGVYAGLVSRVKGWGFVKVFGYLIILWLEMMFWIMSIVGLLDFWRNFRRLPRESVPPHEPQDETDKDEAAV